MSSVTNDLRKKTNQELVQIISKLKNKLLEIKFSMASGEEEKLDNAKEIRKTIARSYTIINERQLKQAKAAAKAAQQKPASKQPTTKKPVTQKPASKQQPTTTKKGK